MSGRSWKALCMVTGIVVLLSACSEPKSSRVTLYRNSPFGADIRVHWATFDASESDPSYNMNNCLMAARLLNANVSASAQAEGKERDNSVGFWCENGYYREEGAIPANFPEAFPTDV